MRKLILSLLMFGFVAASYAQTISSAHEVYFNVGASTLNSNTKSTLDDLVARLKKGGNATYEILVYGYADPTGDEKLNMKLSISRINAVADYLESKGIPKERVFRQIPRGEEQTRSKYVNTEPDLANDKRRSVEILVTPRIDVIDPAGASKTENQ